MRQVRTGPAGSMYLYLHMGGRCQHLVCFPSASPLTFPCSSPSLSSSFLTGFWLFVNFPLASYPLSWNGARYPDADDPAIVTQLRLSVLSQPPCAGCCSPPVVESVNQLLNSYACRPLLRQVSFALFPLSFFSCLSSVSYSFVPLFGTRKLSFLPSLLFPADFFDFGV